MLKIGAKLACFVELAKFYCYENIENIFSMLSYDIF